MVHLLSRKELRKQRGTKVINMLGKRKSQSSGSAKRVRTLTPRRRNTQLKQELKMFPTNATSSVAALTYVDISVSEVGQGDDYTQRDSRKITPVGLWLRESFIPGDANPNVQFRRVVFIDWAYQGVAHGYADVFYNTSPMTVKSYQNTERIQIIKDDFVMLSDYLGASGNRGGFSSDQYIDLSKYYNQPNRNQIQYLGTTGASVGVGAIFIALLCDKAVTFSSTTNIGYQCFTGLTYFDA